MGVNGLAKMTHKIRGENIKAYKYMGGATIADGTLNLLSWLNHSRWKGGVYEARGAGKEGDFV